MDAAMMLHGRRMNAAAKLGFLAFNSDAEKVVEILGNKIFFFTNNTENRGIGSFVLLSHNREPFELSRDSPALT